MSSGSLLLPEASSIMQIWTAMKLKNMLYQVSKSRRNIFFSSNTLRIFLQLSALASKIGRIKKKKYIIMLNSIKLVFLCFCVFLRPLFRAFERLGEEICKQFRWYVRRQEKKGFWDYPTFKAGFNKCQMARHISIFLVWVFRVGFNIYLCIFLSLLLIHVFVDV